MNRVYNNEAILMGCIVHLLKKEKMDMAKLYLYTTLLVDIQLYSFIKKSDSFDQLCTLITNQGLISRKLYSFGPYFLNATVILKQNKFIVISDENLCIGSSAFPDGSLRSKRLDRIMKISEHLLKICSGKSTKELYHNLNIQL